MAIPDFINRIRQQFDREFKKQLYRNLVFKGGGVRGIAYVGALEVLEELGVVNNIERVAGTSAGAIAATMMSFRLSVEETKALFNTLDIPKIAQVRISEQPKKFWQSADREGISRFFSQYGWYASQYLHQFIEEIIASQCGGNGRATFAEFDKREFRELHIVASNVSRHRSETFSVHTTPDVAVADAVRMSMSIPLVFEALRFDGKEFGDGDYYVDGGLYDNFPMHIFDSPKYEKRNIYYSDGINWQTLGLFLYPESRENEADPEIPKDVWEFLMLSLRNLYDSHQYASYDANPVDRHRTIEISDRGVNATDFDITPGNENYENLYQSGKDAARKFFNMKTSKAASGE